MCLILFAFQAHARFPLVVAANRDESYERPAAPAGFWADQPQVCAGRDLEMGGTWMGITRHGRFAAITNFRDGMPKGVAPRSRGDIVRGYLTGTMTPRSYLTSIPPKADEYAGFCTLAGDLHALYFYSNRGNGIEPVTTGIHGLSNHLLDTPWPKVTHGRQRLRELLSAEARDPGDSLFEMLADRSVAPPESLPDTGVGPLREKQLGPKFIAIDERYGTRASTVILVDNTGNVIYRERSFGPLGKYQGEVTRQFRLEGQMPSFEY